MIINKTLNVVRPVDVAFKIFVEEIAQWWPKDTGHSFLGGKTTLILEPKTGGRFYEKSLEKDEEYEIGRVTKYEAGKAVAFTWKHREWPNPTLVELKFSPDGAGTRIDLTHSGWEQIGDDAMAADYNNGWDFVLGFYVKHLDQ